MFYSRDFYYRPARETDIPALLTFLPAVLPGSWSFTSLQQLLQAHEARVLQMRSSDEIAGFAEFSVIVDEAELLNLAIAPRFQRQGLGRRLLTSVVQEVAGREVLRVLLEVRRSNTAARALYESERFTQDGIRPAYYSPSSAGAAREDACLYSLGLSSLSSD